MEDSIRQECAVAQAPLTAGGAAAMHRVVVVWVKEGREGKRINRWYSR